MLREMSWISLVAATLTGVGCGGYQPVPRGQLSEVRRIRDRDGAFDLQENREFRTPFSAGGESERVCRGDVTPEPSEAAFRVGRRVSVEVDGWTTPVYGLLILCDVPSGARGPAARSYLIRVPLHYLEQTSGDRIAVVFEPVDQQHASWILWLRERPF